MLWISESIELSRLEGKEGKLKSAKVSSSGDLRVDPMSFIPAEDVCAFRFAGDVIQAANGVSEKAVVVKTIELTPADRVKTESSPSGPVLSRSPAAVAARISTLSLYPAVAAKVVQAPNKPVVVQVAIEEAEAATGRFGHVATEQGGFHFGELPCGNVWASAESTKCAATVGDTAKCAQTAIRGSAHKRKSLAKVQVDRWMDLACLQLLRSKVKTMLVAEPLGRHLRLKSIDPALLTKFPVKGATAEIADAKAKFVGANSRAAAALYHTGVVAEALGNATTTQAAKVTTEAEWQAEALWVKQAEALFVNAASVPTEAKFDRGIPTARACEAYSVYTAQVVVAAQAVAAQADASRAAVATDAVGVALWAPIASLIGQVAAVADEVFPADLPPAAQVVAAQSTAVDHGTTAADEVFPKAAAQAAAQAAARDAAAQADAAQADAAHAEVAQADATTAADEVFPKAAAQAAARDVAAQADAVAQAAAQARDVFAVAHAWHCC